MAARGRFLEALREGDLGALSRLVEEHGRQALVSGGLLPGRWEALEAAIRVGREESVRWLVENGAWLSHVKHPWVQPADGAAASHLCEVADHDDDECPGFDELFDACQWGHLGIVKYLIGEKGVPPYRKDYTCSLLVAAAQSGHLSVVRYLLQIGAQVRGSDRAMDHGSLESAAA